MGDEHKYHLANWGLISQKKDFGGLGVPNLREFNMALLASWAKRYFMDSNKNWVKLIDHKYKTTKPNILWSRQGVGSPFWKGVTWALEGVRPFYKWKLGNGNKISFWDDIWVGDSSLKTQFWDVYEICQQQHCAVSEVWDGSTLKLTFNRCVEAGFLDRWHELIRIISDMPITDETDQPIWRLESSGVYSVKSFYNMINWGGVSTPIWRKFWKIVVPHRYLVFLWLAFHNKILTRDNLNKRREVENLKCLFCNEDETVCHLFFECVVAKQVWSDISDSFEFSIPNDMNELSSFWNLNNKKSVTNIACVATIYSIWTMRNDMCFQGVQWTSTRAILARISSSLHQWKVLCVGDQSVLLRRCIQLLDRRRGELLRIAWESA